MRPAVCAVSRRVWNARLDGCGSSFLPLSEYLQVCAALSSPAAKCQSGESTVFEKFLFAIFWCLNKKELRLTASHPFLALYMGSERWNQMEHKTKDEKINPAFWMHPPPNCCSRSTGRIFYFYALGVSSAMLKKVAQSHQKTRSFSKCVKTFAAAFRQKASPRSSGLLDQ